ncbi:zinc finger protein [Cystoisospora suis]|uniref:RING-type E3 ubiquitin transferase n=1 Tax=Cystoisospora suis TaxID=483139 RepID=A0A2C6LBV7_9APIC|nr:zinc finger protein [Cystoisospora suis]
MEQLPPPTSDKAEEATRDALCTSDSHPLPSSAVVVHSLASLFAFPVVCRRSHSSSCQFSPISSVLSSSSRSSGDDVRIPQVSSPRVAVVQESDEQRPVAMASSSPSPAFHRGAFMVAPFSRLRGHSRGRNQRRRRISVVDRHFLPRTVGSRRGPGSDLRSRTTASGDRSTRLGAAVNIRRRRAEGQEESRRPRSRQQQRPSEGDQENHHRSRVLTDISRSTYNDTSSSDGVAVGAWTGAAARRGWRTLVQRGRGNHDWTSLLSLVITVSFTCFPLLLIPQALSPQFPDFLLMIPPATSLFLVMALNHPGINSFRLPLLLFCLGPLVIVVATLAGYRWLCQFVFVPLYGVLLLKWPRTCCCFFLGIQLHLELVLISCKITDLPYSGSQGWVVGVLFACTACPFPWCVFASAYSRLSTSSSPCSPSSCFSSITFRISVLLLTLCTLWSAFNSLLIVNLFFIFPSAPLLDSGGASGTSTPSDKEAPTASPNGSTGTPAPAPPGGHFVPDSPSPTTTVETGFPRNAFLLASAAGAAALMGVVMVLLWSSISKKLNWVQGGSFTLIESGSPSQPHPQQSSGTGSTPAAGDVEDPPQRDEEGGDQRRRRRRAVGERRRLSAETPELEFVVIGPLRDNEEEVYMTRDGTSAENLGVNAPGEAGGDDREKHLKSERLLRKLKAQQFQGKGWISTCSTSEYAGVDPECSTASSPSSSASASSASASSPTLPSTTRPSSCSPVSSSSAVSPTSSAPMPRTPSEHRLPPVGPSSSPSSSSSPGSATGSFSPLCTICQERLEAGAWVCELPPCKHIFHARCLRRWLSERGTCPNCNLDLERALEAW